MVYSTSKLASFIRKLYRWGFRQVRSESLANEKCEVGEKMFWHPQFQRDNKMLAMNMKSITVEG
jgi:hypothetical protein